MLKITHFPCLDDELKTHTTMKTNSANIRPPAAGDAPPQNLPTPDDHLWTTPEVAAFLCVSLKTVFNLRKRGLPFVCLGGAVRFVPSEIKNFLINNRGLSGHRARQIARKGNAS